MNENSNPHMTDPQSPQPIHQTRIHVVFAAIGAAALLALIVGLPHYNDWMRERRAQGIQAAVHADLEMIHERELDFLQKNGFFTTDLAALSLDVPKPLAVLYKFGFVRAATDNPPKAVALDGTPLDLDPARMNLDLLLAVNPKLEIALSPTTQLEKIQFSNLASYCADCTATRTTFKIVAAANLDRDPVLDVWTIDEKGEIIHVVNDL